MIIRLIISIVMLIVITCFIGFNLDNKCSLNLLFHTFENVPVFFTAIFSFVIGSVFTLPFAFIARRKRANKKNEKNDKNIDNKTEKNVSQKLAKETKAPIETKTTKSTDAKSTPDKNGAVL